MVDGRIRKRHGELVDIDEARVVRETEAALRALLVRERPGIAGRPAMPQPAPITASGSRPSEVSTARAALRPGRPETDPPGCTVAPVRNRPGHVGVVARPARHHLAVEQELAAVAGAAEVLRVVGRDVEG